MRPDHQRGSWHSSLSISTSRSLGRSQSKSSCFRQGFICGRGRTQSQHPQEVSYHCPACGIVTLWLENNTFPRSCLELPEFGLSAGFLLKNSELWCYHTVWLLFLLLLSISSKGLRPLVKGCSLALLRDLQDTIPRVQNMKLCGKYMGFWARAVWV